MRNKWYIAGIIGSAILHAPLLKDKEYVAWMLSSVLWPLPAIVWTDYMRYVTYSSWRHEQMVARKLGCYSEKSS